MGVPVCDNPEQTCDEWIEVGFCREKIVQSITNLSLYTKEDSYTCKHLDRVYIVDDNISPYSRVKRVTMENKEIEDLRARGGLVK